MDLALATFLILAVIVSSVALAIGIPFALGMLAYDIVQSRKTSVVTAAAPSADTVESHIAIKRGVARAFVIVGAAFWSLAAFSEYRIAGSGASEATLMALVPLAASLATLVIGWYWERVASALLATGALAALAAGVVYGFAPQVWAIVTFALIGPMATAAILFWAARSEQEAYERATSLSPQLAFAFNARSGLGR